MSAAAQHPATDVRYAHAIHGQTNPWAPFQSRNDWEVARWAKLRGKGSNAFNELLAIPGVRSILKIISRYAFVTE